ncbi:MAG: hypothetical protein HC842_09415 [Cytophagales bacterium]|nr:hypothetical protein [Cytophagales bacterium]
MGAQLIKGAPTIDIIRICAENGMNEFINDLSTRISWGLPQRFAKIGDKPPVNYPRLLLFLHNIAPLTAPLA